MSILKVQRQIRIYTECKLANKIWEGSLQCVSRVEFSALDRPSPCLDLESGCLVNGLGNGLPFGPIAGPVTLFTGFPCCASASICCGDTSDGIAKEFENDDVFMLLESGIDGQPAPESEDCGYMYGAIELSNPP